MWNPIGSLRLKALRSVCPYEPPRTLAFSPPNAESEGVELSLPWLAAFYEAVPSSSRGRWLLCPTFLGLSPSGKDPRVGRSTATYPAYPHSGPEVSEREKRSSQNRWQPRYVINLLVASWSRWATSVGKVSKSPKAGVRYHGPGCPKSPPSPKCVLMRTASGTLPSLAIMRFNWLKRQPRHAYHGSRSIRASELAKGLLKFNTHAQSPHRANRRLQPAVVQRPS
ncbi:hypothetical protein C8Q73DRAFT_669164 [Cubamyces lactineus]|nr:hypothetical protein C8Q73DRAFT_669164 [Cubamyces lactineus]